MFYYFIFYIFTLYNDKILNLKTFLQQLCNNQQYFLIFIFWRIITGIIYNKKDFSNDLIY
jgi:deferrochelatase/peroxidase EfeB